MRRGLYRFAIWSALLLSGLPAIGAKAQSTSPATVTLNWHGYEEVLPAQELPGKIPAFAGASLEYTERLPYYRFQLPGTHLGSLQLTQTVYQPFSPEDQKLLGKYNFSPEPAVRISNGTQNKMPVSMVAILPIRHNPQTNQLEKLTQFSYTYTLQAPTTANASPADGNNPGGNSVLSAGDWYKLAVTNTGVHRIDKSTLQALGISPQSIDPRTIQVYGNGGGMLPQPNHAPRPDDLQQNAILVSGEADGRFDDGDYALFYAQGPHTWQYDPAQQQFSHTYNVYSDTAFYFLRVGYEAGLRIASRSQAAGAFQTITIYNERLFHEKDLKNMVYSGREWYGEEFSAFTSSRDISFPATGIVPGSEVKLTAFLMANSPAASSFEVKLNGQALGSQTITGRGTYEYHPEGVSSLQTYMINQQALGQATDLKATLTFSTGGSSSALGYLNYLALQYERQLQLYGGQTSFRSVASMAAPVSTFRIAGAPATAAVWDVTDPIQPVLQQTIPGDGLRFSAATDQLREFVVFRGEEAAYQPMAKGRVANQNLHSSNLDGNLDLVIVTHPGFLQEAGRLAGHRRRHSGMQVLVVTTDQIYNEFSSGAQDVTAIRDFMRMLYGRSRKSGSEALYLLLFGDASYDYKHRLGRNTNFVPVYQSRQSLHPITSYSSEDYYGFLDAGEGEWAENALGDHLLDIGIGRLPAKTAAEAATLVDKIIAYDSPGHFGPWRRQVTFLSDDGNGNDHQEDAEYLATYLEEINPNYHPNKVYLDLFSQAAVASGQRAPEAAAALDKAVEQGSLVVNYTGHGNEISLAGEQVLTIPQINNWQNKDKLTFLLTATCEFGRYDDPARASGAEAALLHPEGGAVGLLTTTRPVYSSDNRVLNRNFFGSAFAPADGRMPRLGDIVLRTKNNSITDSVSGSRGINNRNFTLLGDPSLQLASPTLQARITSINGRQTTTDTLGALAKVTLAGQITTSSGALAGDFSGFLHLKVYEKPAVRKTFGDEGGLPAPVQLRENSLYDGQVTVRNGLFEAAFAVPKDIAYTYGAGKISLYASNSTHEAIGFNRSIIIGGTAKDAAADNTPPVIHLYLNDESFVFGGATGNTATLLAKIYDDNGLNTAGLGIGHELTAVLDGDEDNPLVLNDYYTSEADSYQRGRVRYTLKDLAPGPHSLRLKAWDTHNNAAEEYIEFIVSNDAKLALDHVLNHPNPFSTKTTFHFDHNRPGDNLEVQVQIFTVSGKLVKTLQTTSYSSRAHVADLTWNGRDEYNDILARGVYVYKLSVRSQLDGSKASKYEKLVILN